VYQPEIMFLNHLIPEAVIVLLFVIYGYSTESSIPKRADPILIYVEINFRFFLSIQAEYYVFGKTFE